MEKRSTEIAAGDPVVTPDRRRWRIARVHDEQTRVTFLAQEVVTGAVLTGDVCALEWRRDEQAWVLADRRSDPERRHGDRSGDGRRRTGW